MQNEMFKTIFRNFKDGFLFCDSSGKVIYVNPTYCSLCGIEEDEVLGKDYHDLLGDKTNLIGIDALLYVFAHFKRIEFVGGKDDPLRRCNVTAFPILDENGKLLYALVATQSWKNVRGLFEDLTIKGTDNVRAAIKPMNTVLAEDGSDAIVAESDSMKEAISIALQVAPTEASVLITGASGSGKEVIADLIYRNSRRKGKPFIKINCAAIPPSLMEAELFGYAEGAFTGAMKGGKPGLFEVANEGVVFLDEIGDMPIELQSKILRLIQSKEVMRVGGRKAIKLNIRIISATNMNLEDAIAEKRFREDLYYRINVVPINLLALKKRPEDIEPLIRYFLEEYNREYGKTLRVSPEALFLLKQYSWPGNIRELKNIIERLVVMSQGEFLDEFLIKKFLGVEHTDIVEEGKGKLYASLDALEKEILVGAIQRNSSKRKAATELGIDHSTLIKKCKKYGL